MSNTTLGDFIDGKGGPPLPATLDAYEAWLDGGRGLARLQVTEEVEEHRGWTRAGCIWTAIFLGLFCSVAFFGSEFAACGRIGSIQFWTPDTPCLEDQPDFYVP